MIMFLKTNMIIIVLYIFIVFNYQQYIINRGKYDVEHFSRKMLIQQKYRCIRYFENNDFDKNVEKKCQPYKYEYLNYQLDRSHMIFTIIKNNLLFMILILILVLAC